MPNLTRILSELLSSSPIELRYALSVRMVDLFPGQHVLETEDYDFDPVAFAQEGRCILTVSEDAHPHLDATWDSSTEKVTTDAVTASLEALWRGERISLLRVRYSVEGDKCWFVIGRSAAVTEGFFESVCRFSTASEGQILVFDGNCSFRDRRLLQSLAGASWDDLALPGDLKKRLREDTEGFFAAREFYASLGLPWKRGLLLTGPPGNGKTHALRTVVGALARPTFFVKAFKGREGSEAGVQRLFRRVRRTAPCVVVLEDLDSLVDAKCRSTFLNEMDGFQSNEGILTLATTNYPERLDPALIDRPSRFDRKFVFPMLARAERRELFARYLGERVTAADLDKLARAGSGLSGASVKEASLSGLMAWSRSPESSLTRRVATEIRALKATPALPEEGREEDDEE